MILGVDPGRAAGAALVDGRTVVWWWGWRWLEGKRGRFVLSEPAMADLELRSLHEVARELRVGGASAVVLEGLFVTHKRGRKAGGKRNSLVPLAESAGELLGPLRSLGPVHRPTWNEWTPPGFSASMGSKRAEALLEQVAMREFRWDHPLPDSLPAKVRNGIVEAVWMAHWGAQQ